MKEHLLWTCFLPGERMFLKLWPKSFLFLYLCVAHSTISYWTSLNSTFFQQHLLLQPYFIYSTVITVLPISLSPSFLLVTLLYLSIIDSTLHLHMLLYSTPLHLILIQRFSNCEVLPRGVWWGKDAACRRCKNNGKLSIVLWLLIWPLSNNWHNMHQNSYSVLLES